MKLPAHACRLAILAGLGITLIFGSAGVRADEPPANPDETLRRVAESLEAADVPPELRGRILDLIRSRQAANPQTGPEAEAGDGVAPPSGAEQAPQLDAPGRAQAIREKQVRDRKVFQERLRQGALEADREAEEARMRAERLRAFAEREMSEEDRTDRGDGPFGGGADHGGHHGGSGMGLGGPGMGMFGVPMVPAQVPGFEIGVVLDLRTGQQIAIAEVANGSAAELAGVRRGDQVLRADGDVLQSLEQLSAAVQRAGTEQRPLELVVRRGEEEVVLSVQPTRRPQSFPPWAAVPGLGPWPMMPHGPQAHGFPQPHGPRAEGDPRQGLAPPRQGISPHGGMDGGMMGGGPGGRMGGGMGGMMGGGMGGMMGGGMGGMMGGGVPWQRDLDGLRQEVESLRKELNELRESLKSRNAPAVPEPAVEIF